MGEQNRVIYAESFYQRHLGFKSSTPTIEFKKKKVTKSKMDEMWNNFQNIIMKKKFI